MKKILVIEDEMSVRDNIVELLDAENFETVAAENGVEGVKRAREELPDLILCDVMMPHLDGYGVLEALQSDRATATIPFIFLTAKAEKADTRKGMELGADDYLTKPFTIEELLGAIAPRLQKQATIAEQSQEKLEELRNTIALSLPHELRTPINGILGYAQLLAEDYEDLDREEALEMLEGIQVSAKRLHRLVQNYLLYAEIEIVARDPQRLQYWMNNLGAHSPSEIERAARSKLAEGGREGDLCLDLETASIAISAVHLHKIVEELIDNACKYSSPGTPIRVVGRKEEPTDYCLRIVDRGRGMSATQIANIGAYMQFERKLYEQQGSGLGLAIVRRLSQLYGGDLKLDSVPEGETTATVRLPLLEWT
jgi:signal transduction histidine kinase